MIKKNKNIEKTINLMNNLKKKRKIEKVYTKNIMWKVNYIVLTIKSIEEYNYEIKVIIECILFSKNNKMSKEFFILSKSQIQESKNNINVKKNSLEKIIYNKKTNSMQKLIIEIRAGTGGDEACIFAGELFKMYKCNRYFYRNKQFNKFFTIFIYNM